MFPILCLGIVAAGGIFATTNPAYTSHELAHHYRTSETKYIIAEPEILPRVIVAAGECNIPKSSILIFDVLGQSIPAGFLSYQTLLSHGEEDWYRFDDLHTAKTVEACRLFSSGTTGLPKATMISHHNLIAQHVITWSDNKRDHRVRRLICLPMFHMAMMPTSHIATLKEGQPSVVMRQFELEKFLANIEKFSITDMALAPPIVISAIMSPLSKKYNLKSVRSAICGAAPLGKDPQERFQQLMSDGAPFTQAYGMTETTCLVTRLRWPENDDTGSIGRLLPNLDVKLIDDEGAEIHDLSKPGEVLVRGPTVILGYVKNDKANRESFDAEGFYHSGDVGRCDIKTGLWYLVDRKKELIKVKAFQVAPPELEGVLLSHPLIIDAAVIGVATGGKGGLDDGGGQLPRAYIVRKAGKGGKSLTEAEAYDWVKDRLVRYKWLEGGVRFIDAIPKNASGKILKRVLRDMAVREMGSKL